MPRIKLETPTEFEFSFTLPVRITDINYGNHLGNDAVLSLLHEARMQFLASKQLSELEFRGVSLIMSDVTMEFKTEAFYGDVLRIYVKAGEVGRAGFSLFYKVYNESRNAIIALAKTGMVCFDYKSRKVVGIPAGVGELLQH